MFPAYRSHTRRGGYANTLVHDMSLLSDDLDPRPNNTGIEQITALHEFGHYLGLNHVRPESDHPYGVPGSWEEGDLMGSGSRWDDWHGWPWLNRIRQHVSSWSAPSSLRDHPAWGVRLARRR